MPTDNPFIDFSDRHISVQHAMRGFSAGHLPAHLSRVAGPCIELAERMVAELPDDPELTVGLRKLLEAKDAFVRVRVWNP